MRTGILLTFFFVMPVIPATAQFDIYQAHQTTDHLNLSAKVKSIDVLHYSLRRVDPWDKKNTLRDTFPWTGIAYHFNEAGNCTEYVSYTYKDGVKEIDARRLTTYDEHQHVTRDVYYDKDSIYSTETTSYVYDSLGRITETVYMYFSHAHQAVLLHIRRTYEYTPYNTIRGTTIDLNNSNHVMSRDEYDVYGGSYGGGYVLERSLDNWSKMVRHKRNEQGQVIEEVWRDHDNNLVRAYHLSYNAQGQVAAKKEFDANYDHQYNYNYEYDSRGNCTVETCCDEEDKFISQYKHTYDDRDNLIKTTHMKNRRNIDFEVMYALTYDAHGNWVSRVQTTTTENLSPNKIGRTITYYP